MGCGLDLPVLKLWYGSQLSYVTLGSVQWTGTVGQVRLWPGRQTREEGKVCFGGRTLKMVLSGKNPQGTGARGYLFEDWTWLLPSYTKPAGDEPTYVGLKYPAVPEKLEDVHFLLSD